MHKLVWILAAAAVVAAIFGACRNASPHVDTAGGNDKSAASRLVRFTYGTGGMSAESCLDYTFTRTENGALVEASLSAGRASFAAEIPSDYIDRIEAILTEQKISKWDGFKGKPPLGMIVSDGESFSLYAEYEDGAEIRAAGDNRFPDGYSDLCQTLTPLLEEVKQTYGNLYPKTLESDDLNYLSLRFYQSPPAVPSFDYCFIVSTEGNGRVRLELTAEDDSKAFWQRTGRYFFHGHVERFPFEEIQELVRYYDLPSWNGAQRAAGSAEGEQFSIHLSYTGDERIGADGPPYPEEYNDVRKKLIEWFIRYIEENETDFQPVEGLTGWTPGG